MTMPASPFLSDSDAMCAPSDEAAALQPATSLGAAADISDIGQIFIGAQKLIDPDARFILNEAEFMAAVEDVPLFLRRVG